MRRFFYVCFDAQRKFKKSILHKRQSENTFRSLTTAQNVIDFCSNDYLGFAKKTQQIHADNGSTGSRLISGNHLIHEEVENNIAHFHQVEAALIFNSNTMPTSVSSPPFHKKKIRLYTTNYVMPP